MTLEPAIDERGERLQKYLARAGAGSRRECERLISEGRISVDGQVVTELGTRIVPGIHVVRVDGARVEPPPLKWIALNKPAGYLTTRTDDRNRPTVYELLPEKHHRLFHVGRLDRMTEGLLILTNDGDVAHRLLHPRYGLARRYRAEVEGAFGADEARRLERGIRLEDGFARVEDIEAQPTHGLPRGTIVSLTLREGRKREVRRLLEALGLTVRRLIRTSFGSVQLADLEPGAWRVLELAEIEALRRAVGMGDSGGDR